MPYPVSYTHLDVYKRQPFDRCLYRPANPVRFLALIHDVLSRSAPSLYRLNPQKPKSSIATPLIFSFSIYLIFSFIDIVVIECSRYETYFSTCALFVLCHPVKWLLISIVFSLLLSHPVSLGGVFHAVL